MGRIHVWRRPISARGWSGCDESFRCPMPISDNAAQKNVFVVLLNLHF